MQNRDHNKMLILASASPRRNDLLKQAGVPFCVVPSEFEEESVEHGEPFAYVRHLAEAKADDVAGNYPDSWVLGADTIVLDGERILGKPASANHAREMLRSLSGKAHRVLTGFAVVKKSENRILSEVVDTEVRFKPLSEAEIDWYVKTEEPFGKAGAYAIQGIGSFLVRGITGSYTNVVGLPVCEVIETLTGAGVIAFHPEDKGRYEFRGA